MTMNFKICKALKKVIFDLETSGLGRNCEILQMALVDVQSSNINWNQYLQPTKPIDPGASTVNHLRIGINNKLQYKGIECRNVVSAKEGIMKFQEYLKCNYPDGVTLIAHNGENFDFPLLKKYLEMYNTSFSDGNESSYPIKCIDSLLAFRRHYRGLSSYRQDYLIKKFSGLSTPKDAHEALGDCINLSNAIKVASAEKNLSISQFLL